jgi:Protein of unknown function (DUF3619)
MSIDNVNHQDIENKDFEEQGRQIASLLNDNAKRLSMRTLKQLENGRERALKAHAAQVSVTMLNKDGSLSSLSGWTEHYRIVSAGFVMAAIIVGFLLMQVLSSNESSDAFLLSADLPPEAFVDRGFEPTLNDGKANL